MIHLPNDNSKLGMDICCWNLPANAKICVGSTPACSAACYAKKGCFVFSTNQKIYERNYQLSRRPDFAALMIKAVKAKKKNIFRIHSIGDFYSQRYAEKWLEVFKACPEKRFYFYTRSWNKPKILTVFRKMMQLPNVVVWFSYDKTSIKRPNGKYLWAYMAQDENDIAEVGNVVFKVKRDVKQLRNNSIIVCPVENGVKRDFKITCSRCKLCWSDFVKEKLKLC